jgi:sulfatase maturation enzyme AslB (radical SAM superfamily)
MIDNTGKLIRETTSTCPDCRQEIKAYIIEKHNKIYMKKSCLLHGAFELLVSNHPSYYRGLTQYYFEVMPEKMEQRRYYVYLSNKCNLDCPICLLEPNQSKLPDISLLKFKETIKNYKKSRFYLYGAEPTLRPDLEDWIKVLKQNGNLVNMHTNGIKLTDYAYSKKLKEEGLDYVSLQFDGFDDKIYLSLRGQSLLEIKLKALENLRKLNIPTGFNVTIAKGVNENQIGAIIDYAVKNRFIRDVSFATLSLLGPTGKNFPPDSMLMPDELIDMTEEQTKGRISRKNVFLFQKLYYALLSVFNIRRCYNFQHLALIRDKNGGYSTFDRLLKLECFEKKLDTYKKLRKSNRMSASLYFITQVSFNFLFSNFLEKLQCVPLNIIMPGKIRSPKIPSKVLLLSFGTVCDYIKYDSQISKYCGQGFCFEDKDKVVLTDNISDLSLFDNKICK